MEGFFAVAAHGADHLIEAFLLIYIARLGEEFVGITDEFFFERLWGHIAKREGERLRPDIIDGESGACVSFTD